MKNSIMFLRLTEKTEVRKESSVDNEMEMGMGHGMGEIMYEEMDRAAKKDMDRVGCSAVGYQDVNVCIPVTIKTFGEAGNAKTQCLGKAIISSGCDSCAGKSNDVCKFTISQKLRVEVPVIFGARAEVGKASVDCDYAVNCGCSDMGV